MARREQLPPADVIFGHGRTATPPPAAPKHVKVTVYMPADMVAALDEKRATLRRDGITVDRGRLVRSAVHLAQNRSAEWLDVINEED